MKNQGLDHWPYLIYQDEFENLYIQDRDEGLTFIRGKLNKNKYDLAVIIEEDNSKYEEAGFSWTDSELPFGFQILDEITLKEWNKLVKSYLTKKNEGTLKFNDWIKKEMYTPLFGFFGKLNSLVESMPYPGAPNRYWKNFERVLQF